MGISKKVKWIVGQLPHNAVTADITWRMFELKAKTSVLLRKDLCLQHLFFRSGLEEEKLHQSL